MSEIIREGGASRPSRFTVEEMFGLYAQRKELGRTDKNVMVRFCRDFGPRRVVDVGVEELHAWARKRKIGNDTWRRELNVWGAAMNYARRHGYGLPEVDLVKPPAGDGRVRWASKEEKERLMEVLGQGRRPWLRDLVVFLLLTGARVGEALGLEWQDTHMESVVLTTRKRREGRVGRRRVPLVGEAREIVQRLIRERGEAGSRARGPFDRHYDVVRNAWVEACEQAKVDDLRMHDLRHTFASDMLRAGTSPKVVADLMGHTTLQLIDRYGHLVQGDLESALAKVFVAQD